MALPIVAAPDGQQGQTGMDEGRRGQSTVVQLRPGKTASDDTLQLVKELRTAASEILSARLTQMFEGADDLLFEFAERAGNNVEQRLYFDTMRTVRLGRPEMMLRFTESLDHGFEVTPAGSVVASPETQDEDFSLQDSSMLEKDIAITNMASKAEGLYKQALWEIGRRFSTLVELRNAPMSLEAVSPQAICDAFRSGAESLRVDLSIELVIYKLFDRLVVSELGELYAQVLHLLKQHGVQSVALAAPVTNSPVRPQGAEGTPPSQAFEPGNTPNNGSGIGREPPSAWHSGGPQVGGGSAGFSGIGPAALPGWSQAISSMASGHRPAYGSGGAGGVMPGGSGQPPSSLDAQTLGVLNRLQGAGQAGLKYDNDQLAADLAAAASGNAIAGWAPGQAAAYVQRSNLVSRMFHEILGDPNLPHSLQASFESLRQSVLKTALNDPEFIADPSHPVRNLVNELATIASAARTAEADSLSRIERLVDEIRSQFEVAAEAVRAPAADAKPFTESDAERFVQQQAAQTEVRRLAIIKKVRRIVAEELQLRTLGITLGTDVRPLVYSAWAPMMAVHLLRSGPESPEWRHGLTLLENVLTSLSPAAAGTALGPSARDTLITDLRDSFAAVGLAETRIAEVLTGLGKALDTPPPPAPSMAAPEAPSPADAAITEAGDIIAGPVGEAGSGPAAAAQPGLAVPAATAPAVDDTKALLDMLIVPGAWFRIFDRDRQCDRWLKAVSLYPGMDCVAFAEFNGKNTLLVKASLLLEDLAARRAEPLDMTPATRHALQDFLAASVPAPV